jgi:hypothetical protein
LNLVASLFRYRLDAFIEFILFGSGRKIEIAKSNVATQRHLLDRNVRVGHPYLLPLDLVRGLDGDLRNLIIVVLLAIGVLSGSGSRQRKSERQEYQLHGRSYRKNKTLDPA